MKAFFIFLLALFTYLTYSYESCDNKITGAFISANQLYGIGTYSAVLKPSFAKGAIEVFGLSNSGLGNYN